MSKLIKKLEKKLLSSKFRLLTSYMSTNTNLKRITKNTISDYHKGYKNQIKNWSKNPLETVIKFIKTENLKNLNIADLGCGEAQLSKEFKNVLSFDLFPVKEEIIKADLENLPLENKTQDVAVLCLSLLKENIFKALKEANRILKENGKCLIVETKGRIDQNDFEKVLKSFLGFNVSKKEIVDGYFIFYVLEKFEDSKKEDGKLILKEFEYKKR